MSAAGSSVRTAAALLRARGFALCKPDPAQKKPTYSGWPTRSLEPGDFAPGDMIGVLGGPLSSGNRPGHATVLIDLDGAEAVARADDRLPPSGMTEGRPSKPRSHRYYLVPLDSIPAWARSTAPQGAKAAEEACGHPGPFIKSLRHRDTDAETIRLIGTGGLGVCPPSRHESGEDREWDGGTPGEPAVVPFLALWQAVCELGSECGAEVPDVLPRPPVPVRPRSRDGRDKVTERAVKYLTRMGASVSGQNGHGALFRAARALVYGFDLPPAEALSILDRDFNPRCLPAWSPRELEHKVSDADRTPFDRPRGYLRDADRRDQSRVRPTNTSMPAMSNLLPTGPGPGPVPVPTFPPPQAGEGWNDPHRLARLYVDSSRTAEGEPTLVQWRDEYHTWADSAWRAVPDTDLDARLARHCRDVIEADYPLRVAAYERGKGEGDDEAGGKRPALFPVTAAMRANVRVNLGGLVNMADTGADAPLWRSADPDLPDTSEVVAAPNGLFTLADIATGRGPFRPPTPQFFTPNALPFPVQSDPPLPETWLRCLREWFSGDAASILGAQEVMGYLLSTCTVAHKIPLLVGPKRTGKGTFIWVNHELVGAANVASTSFAALGESFGLEDLLGKRVAVIPDARLSGRTDIAAVVERLLSISGEDIQSVNRKNRRRITTLLKARFLIATNEIPHLPDSSGALASRFHILSMPNSFFNKEDRSLKKKLRGELPGILVWAAKGFVRLRTQGFAFTPNDAATRYQRQLEDLSSPVRAFVRERCSVGPACEVRIAELYAAWQDWNNVRNRKPTDDNIFGRDLTSAFPHIVRSQPRVHGIKVRVYKGIGLRERADWGDDEEYLERTGTRSNPTHATREEGLFPAA